MQLITTFPGPRAALAWHFVRYHQWQLVTIYFLATLFGCLLGRDATTDPTTTHVLLLLLPVAFLSMSDMQSNRTASMYLLLRMPVPTAKLYWVETMCFCASLALAGACSWLTFNLTAPPSIALGTWPLFLLACSGFYLHAWVWSIRAGNRLLLGLTLFAMPIVFILYVLHAFFPFPIGPLGTGQGPILVVAGAIAAYFISQHLMRTVRAGTCPSLRPSKATTMGESHVGSIAKGVPFVSTSAAQIWFEKQSLFHPGSSALNVISCWALAVFCGPVLIAEQSVLGLGLPDIGIALGVILTSIRLDAGRNWLDFQLPLSDWKLSVHFLRFSFQTLVVVTVAMGIVTQSWTVLVAGGASLSITSLLLLLWAAWCALAMGPAIFLASIPWMYMEEVPWSSLEFTATVVFGLYLTSIILLATFPNRRRYTPGVLIAIATVFTIVAGNLALQYLNMAPEMHAVIRELLGAFLVLAFTYHHVELGLIPARAGRVLAGLLVASVIAACLYHGVAPYREAAPSFTAVLFTLGVLPPVFLPFLIQPQFIAWQRFSIEFQKNWTRSAQWLK